MLYSCHIAWIHRIIFQFIGKNWDGPANLKIKGQECDFLTCMYLQMINEAHMSTLLDYVGIPSLKSYNIFCSRCYIFVNLSINKESVFKNVGTKLENVTHLKIKDG